jgi:hypothetical protein
MGKRLKETEIVRQGELRMFQVITRDPGRRILFEEGIISKEEIFTNFKQIHAQYESKKGTPH